MAPRDIRQHHEAILAAAGGQWFDFEGLVRDIYVSILAHGDTALEVGVNEGVHFHQMVERVGPQGRVIGVEAAPAMAEKALEGLRCLGLGGRPHVLHNVAVSDYSGTARFFFVKDQPGLSSLAARDAATGYLSEEIEVPVTTIDALLEREPGRIAFTKIDIEGAEFSALKAAGRVFRDGGPIVFEFDHETPRLFGFHPDDMAALFAGHGYVIHDFFGNRFGSGSDLMASAVWNFFAAPAGGFERHDVARTVARSLARGGIALPPAA